MAREDKKNYGVDPHHPDYSSNRKGEVKSKEEADEAGSKIIHHDPHHPGHPRNKRQENEDLTD